ncbi:hypothetical protein AGMMS4956_00960 [Bacteroidia bacterium]|nr:hypothetical protein AGMMS4956_00960 [Bacteroidia bacterium]
MESFFDYISINSQVRFGKPCVKGTRIAVSDILKWMASGMSVADITNDYPLNEYQIRAALAFSAQRDKSLPQIH